MASTIQQMKSTEQTDKELGYNKTMLDANMKIVHLPTTIEKVESSKQPYDSVTIELILHLKFYQEQLTKRYNITCWLFNCLNEASRSP